MSTVLSPVRPSYACDGGWAIHLAAGALCPLCGGPLAASDVLVTDTKVRIVHSSGRDACHGEILEIRPAE